MNTKQFGVSIDRITPSQAKRILDNNTSNRKIKAQSLSRLKRDLEQDQFYLSPDAIHIGRDGTLFNGQHRLLAVTETGKSAVFIVLRGGGKEIQDITDDGVKRQPGDVLHIAGVQNASLTAASLRLVICYVNKTDPRYISLPNKEILKAYEIYEGFGESVAVAAKYNNEITPPSYIGAFHYLFSTVSPEDADEFFEKLATGYDLGKGDPILALRNRILKERSSGGVKMLRGIPPLIISGWIVRSWNAWRRNQEMSRLITSAAAKWIPDIDGCTIKRKDIAGSA